MKNNSFKILSLLGLIAIVYFLTNDIGYCAATAAQTTQTVTEQTAVNSEFSKTVIKFLYVMGGVALSSFIIFGGLTIYNKIFVKHPNYPSDENSILKTPKSIDDAIIFFIKKNKLN